MVEPNEAQEISERDQLWASLRGLRPEIAKLSIGDWDESERQKQLVILLARIVVAEMGFRGKDASEA